MVDHIFREYDIRGIVGSEFLLENTYDLVRAIAVLFKEHAPSTKRVAVGMDGRTHSQAIKEHTVRALLDSGLDVVFLGMCPTPVLYFSQHILPVDAGIMITASHNPAVYNGMKLCLNKDSVWGVQLRRLRDLFNQRACTPSSQPGTYEECDGVGLYVDYLAQQFAHLKHMDMGVVVDCGNAVGGLVMPRLKEALNWRGMEFLYTDIDGTFPNHEADPVVEANMRVVKALLTARDDLSLGIGFDGDCDRMAPMTKVGFLVPGDQLLAVFAEQIVKKYPDACVVFDVRVSSGLIDALERFGARPHLSACGHSIIKNEMKKQGAMLAGELSCHFFFKDRYFGYDDGIYAALRLLEIIATTGKSLDELIAIFPHYYNSPEIRLYCDQARQKEVVAGVARYFAARTDARLITVDGVRAVLPYGWGLVRASNTQAAISLRFESSTAESLQRIKQEFAHILEPYVDRAALEQQFWL